MSEIWFTSDTHFNHQKIISLCDRPFSDTEDMNKKLVNNWNAIVLPEDDVYHLGDLMFMSNLENVEKTVKILNGKIHLIMGNHDDKRIWSHWKYLGFKSVASVHYLRHKKFRLYLSHYPHMMWKGSTKGAIHLHGHTHGTIDIPNGFRMMDVGVDANNYKPVNIDTIIDKFKTLWVNPNQADPDRYFCKDTSER